MIGELHHTIDACIQCSLGMYAPTMGSDYCQVCPSGRYMKTQINHRVNSANCTAWSTCEAGYRYIEGSNISNAACIECNDGEYQSETASTAKVCLKWSTCKGQSRGRRALELSILRQYECGVRERCHHIYRWIRVLAGILPERRIKCVSWHTDNSHHVAFGTDRPDRVVL